MFSKAVEICINHSLNLMLRKAVWGQRWRVWSLDEAGRGSEASIEDSEWLCKAGGIYKPMFITQVSGW